MEGEAGAVPVVMTPTTTTNDITAEQRLKRIVDLVFLPVETTALAATFGCIGAAEGALLRGSANYTDVPLKRAYVNEGTICALRIIREKDDTKARLVAGFTSGFMFHLVGTRPARLNVQAAVGTGLLSALGRGLIHQVKSRSEPPAVEDTRYTRTRCMLSELGLEGYEKQFKKHLLKGMDETMHLLNESDLEKAGIHLGARKLILNHIERNPDLRNMGGVGRTHVV